MTRQILSSATTAVAVLFFTACSTVDTAKNPAFDLGAARRQIDSVNQELSQSLAKGDSVAAAACYASDAKFMVPNATSLSGRKEIAGDFGNLFRSGITDLKISTVDVWGTEAALTEEGTWTLAMKNGQQVDKGKFISVWKKEDGKWKLFRDIINSDLPATPH